MTKQKRNLTIYEVKKLVREKGAKRVIYMHIEDIIILSSYQLDLVIKIREGKINEK